MPVISAPPAGTGVSLRLVGGTTAELDLTTYINLVEGEGFDPADGDFLEPVFTDSSIGAGQSLVNIDVQNKEMQFPLHLKAATKDSLHALVRTLRLKLSEPGVLVEWRDADATDVTYYDLEFGRFDPGYLYHRGRHNRVSGTLRCWTRPYGHTATERIVGTAAGSGFMQTISVADLAGDVSAVTTLEITGTGSLGEERDVWGMSVVPSGAQSEWRAASLVAIAAATLVGEDTAVGSQYQGIYVGTSSAELARINLAQASLVGNQRVLALARTPNRGGCYLRHSVNDRSSPTALLTATYPLYTLVATPWRGWQLIDLGAVHLASPAIRAATMTISVFGGLASYTASSLVASPGIHLAALYVLPEDRTSLIIDRGDVRTVPARMKLDGVNRETYDYSSFISRTEYQRGGIPDVSLNEQVLSFSGGARTSGNHSGVLRVRERFSFQR